MLLMLWSVSAMKMDPKSTLSLDLIIQIPENYGNKRRRADWSRHTIDVEVDNKGSFFAEIRTYIMTYMKEHYYHPLDQDIPIAFKFIMDQNLGLKAITGYDDAAQDFFETDRIFGYSATLKSDSNPSKLVSNSTNVVESQDYTSFKDGTSLSQLSHLYPQKKLFRFFFGTIVCAWERNNHFSDHYGSRFVTVTLKLPKHYDIIFHHQIPDKSDSVPCQCSCVLL